MIVFSVNSKVFKKNKLGQYQYFLNDKNGFASYVYFVIYYLLYCNIPANLAVPLCIMYRNPTDTRTCVRYYNCKHIHTYIYFSKF